MRRAIGLSAQTICGVDPARLVELARHGGFDRVGIAVDPETWSAGDTARVRRALADEGIVLQDVEVIRIVDRVTPDMRRLIDIAADLGAEWVIAIGLGDDLSATAERLAELVAYVAGSGTAPILEYGRFTGVRTLAAAHLVAERAGVRLLLDPLHVARSGATPMDIHGLPDALLPYAQLCDAGPAPLGSDRASLLDEARDHRVDIGHGTLDLRAFVAALPPTIPLMNEVRSDRMRRAFPDPAMLARALGDTMRNWLEETGL